MTTIPIIVPERIFEPRSPQLSSWEETVVLVASHFVVSVSREMQEFETIMRTQFATAQCEVP